MCYLCCLEFVAHGLWPQMEEGVEGEEADVGTSNDMDQCTVLETTKLQEHISHHPALVKRHLFDDLQEINNKGKSIQNAFYVHHSFIVKHNVLEGIQGENNIKLPPPFKFKQVCI